jgi:NADH:ubiquinone oxidoreductase subunit D
VGILDTRAFEDWSLSGVMARSIGLKQDLRINYPYDIYNDLEFHSIFSKNGDSFDRYLIRIEEMKESAFLINQCLNLICSGSIKSENEKITFPRKVKIMETMESVISHFKNFTDGVIIEEGKCYVSVEAPKGEFGVFLITNNFNKPHRCKFRAPGFYHLQALDYMAFNVLLADLVAIIGTQDIVFGEIDR